MTSTNGTTPLPPRIDPDRMGEILTNAMAARQEWFRKFLDPRRDIEAECGHPSLHSAYNADEYQTLFDRDPIAERVVTLYPRECWQTTPQVYETDDPSVTTPFEEAWDNLGASLRGEDSWYKDEEGSPVWPYLQRLDEQAGIGQFGVLLIGIDDGLELREPVAAVEEMQDTPDSTGPFAGFGLSTVGTDAQYSSTFGLGRPGYLVPEDTGSGYIATRRGQEMQDRKDGKQGGAGQKDDKSRNGKKNGKGRKLLFLRVFPESLVQIIQYEANPGNPRFGQPVLYRITLNDPRSQHTGVGLPLSTVEVHWSRVIHVADTLRSSEVFGAPRMRTVLGRILDLRKLYGGSAEMYWKGAFFGLSLETNPQLGGDVIVNTTELKDEIEKWQNGLERVMKLIGMTAKVLSPTVVDPTAQITAQIEAICIQLGCPKRVFMGSERGELASSQDDQAWNDRLRFRQQTFITPRIIIPFIDRLIAMGVLPTPCTDLGPKGMPGLLPGQAPGAAGMGMGVGPDGKPVPTSGMGVQQPNGTDGEALERGSAGGRVGTIPGVFNPVFPGGAGGTEAPFSSSQKGVGEGSAPEDAEARQPRKKGKNPFSANAFPPAARPPQAGGPPKPPQPPPAPGALPRPPGAPKGPAMGGPPGRQQAPAPGLQKPVQLPPEKHQKRGYSVYWPDLTSQSDAEKAQVAVARTGALAQYVSGGLESLVPPLDYLTKVMEFEEEEARQMLEAGAVLEEEAKAEEMLQQQQQQSMQAEAMAAAGLDPEEWMQAQQEMELLKGKPPGLVGGMGKGPMPFPPGTSTGGEKKEDEQGPSAKKPPFPPKPTVNTTGQWWRAALTVEGP